MSQDLPEMLPADLRARLANRGSVVVFVGAGAASSAGLPTWTDLVDNAIERHQVEVGSATDLKPIRSLDSWLETIPDATPTPLHDAIARIKPRAVVTTNFDNLIEQAMIGSGQAPVVVTGTTGAEVPDVGDSIVFKLHGSIDQPETLALTPGAALMARERTADDWRLRALLNTSLVLAIGYSPDSGELDALYEDLGASAQQSNWLMLTPQHDPVREKLWRDRGVETLHLDSDATVDLLDDIARAEPGSERSMDEARGGRVLVSAPAGPRRLAVIDLLRSLGLEPYDVGEQMAGSTIFQSITAAIASADAAVVLLDTPDDPSRPQGVPANVIFELGLLIGHLGTDRVLVLLGPDAGVPSDLAGVSYALFDSHLARRTLGEWAASAGLKPADPA